MDTLIISYICPGCGETAREAVGRAKIISMSDYPVSALLAMIENAFDA